MSSLSPTSPNTADNTMTRQRIVSLLPSTTEILCALGAGPDIVGVTHECDFPPFVLNLPKCTSSLLPPDLTAAEIDTCVSKTLLDDAHSIYALDHDLIRSLAPTIMVTQALCEVCAVPKKTVDNFACTLPAACRVVAADPINLIDMISCVRAISRAIDRPLAGDKVVESLSLRLDTLKATVVPCTNSPSVVVLEWPDPPFAPGHWVPDQIAAAGGTCVLGESGVPSSRVVWQDMLALHVDIIVCAFCGYDLAGNQKQVDLVRQKPNVDADAPDWADFAKGKRVYAMDASAYFSRPGVRLVDGAELLAFVLHRLEDYRPQRGAASELTEADGWVDLADV